MRIILTNHAKIRLRQRKIGISKIFQTIIKPDLKSLEEEPNTISYYKKITNNLSIKVVTITKESRVIVLTVYPITAEKLSKVTSFIDQS